MQGVLIFILVAIAILAVFKPTRPLIGACFGKGGPVMLLLHYLYGVLFTIYKDHLLVFKNFAPRRVIFKTLEKDKKK